MISTFRRGTMLTRFLVGVVLTLVILAAGYSIVWLIASQTLMARITEEANYRSQEDGVEIYWEDLAIEGFPVALTARLRQPVIALGDGEGARIWRGTEARISAGLFSGGKIGVAIDGTQEIETNRASGSRQRFFLSSSRLHFDLEAQETWNDFRLVSAHADGLEIRTSRGTLLFGIKELRLQGDLRINEHRQIDGFLQVHIDKEGAPPIPPLLRVTGAVKEIPGEDSLVVEATFRDGKLLLGVIPLVEIGPLY